MGPGERVVPVKYLGLWVLVLAVGVSREAGAQPSDLYACLERGGGTPYYCAELISGVLLNLDCNRSYGFYSGRVAWYPLRCVGPITIEVNAQAHLSNRYPLYIEIIPAPAFPPPRDYSPCYEPGYVVMTARGGFGCDPWESVGPVDITPFIPLGSTYAVQVVFFHTRDGFVESPGLDCLRITAHPVTSALSQVTWTRIKTLYSSSGLER